jgi:D-arabinose 1-dehydrogenase-like Zn-dependent alcohol dehydrogenase
MVSGVAALAVVAVQMAALVVARVTAATSATPPLDALALRVRITELMR